MTTGRRQAAFRAWMVEAGLRPTAIALKSGVAATTIYSFLQGKTSALRGDAEERIAAAYGVTVDDMFGGSDAAGGAGEPRGAGIDEAILLLEIWRDVLPERRAEALDALGRFRR